MSDQERRRFFRIDDSLKLSYRELNEQETEDRLSENVPQSPIAALFSLDQRVNELVTYFQSQSPEIGELLGLINKKIDSVIDLVAVESGILHRVAYTVHQVNVSACGIAFSSYEAFDTDTILGLDMILTPDDHHVSALGRVISCEENASNQEDEKLSYFIRLDFEKITDIDQEVLIQHLVKRQLVLYRRDKEQAVS